MRAEQHGDPELHLQRLHQFDHLALMVRVEADQRLVEQQQARPADQRLRQQQALPLAARESRRAAAAPARARRPGPAPDRPRARACLLRSGRPRRWPSTTLATKSQPLSRMSGERAARPAAYSRSPRCRAPPAAPARGSCRRLGGTSPRTARISVVLPAPFGPSTPTNSPPAMSRLTPARMARPPSARAHVAEFDRVHAPLFRQRAIDRVEFAQHPRLVGLAGRLGLGRADDRDAATPWPAAPCARRSGPRPGCCRPAA